MTEQTREKLKLLFDEESRKFIVLEPPFFHFLFRSTNHSLSIISTPISIVTIESIRDTVLIATTI